MTISLEQNPASIFPDDVLTDPHTGKSWCVAHVKSRREKALAHYFAGAAIGYYLPRYLRRQAGKSRARTSLIPVFPGYLFFRADDMDRHIALRSNHIARIIEVFDEQNLILELSQINKALSGNMAGEIQVYPYDAVSEGQWVRVTHGPFKDVTGRIVRKDRIYRLTLSVETIRQAIVISIDANQVTPIDPQTGVIKYDRF
ncbi:MAG: transcription termination/antitermination NusG family protein [Desulfosalsimonadaceae bacterium]|nr:transcription termination/antitermination NusG family protein [Desulfosalsimonadaceae bacterium]